MRVCALKTSRCPCHSPSFILTRLHAAPMHVKRTWQSVVLLRTDGTRGDGGCFISWFMRQIAPINFLARPACTITAFVLHVFSYRQPVIVEASQEEKESAQPRGKGGHNSCCHKWMQEMQIHCHGSFWVSLHKNFRFRRTKKFLSRFYELPDLTK